MSNELIQIALEDYQLCYYEAHGPIHWARVIDNGKRLADYYGMNPRILELFGAFHDCRRVTESHDINHGVRGREAMWALASRDGVTPEEFDLAKEACTYHTGARPGNGDWPIEIQICLDANHLDLLRTGCPPDPQYLFTAFARTAAMRSWANERALRHFQPDWLEL